MEAIKITKDSFVVYGTAVPIEYLEGHRQKFEVLVDLVCKGASFDFENDHVLISPRKEGAPGPNGEPGGEGGCVNFTIEDEVLLAVNSDSILSRGVAIDRSDTVTHAIQVYSCFREFLSIHESIVVGKRLHEQEG